MTRKHFEQLVQQLKAVKPDAAKCYPVCEFNRMEYQWRHCIGAVIKVCEASNPKFNRIRFLKAAGV